MYCYFLVVHFDENAIVVIMVIAVNTSRVRPENETRGFESQDDNAMEQLEIMQEVNILVEVNGLIDKFVELVDGIEAKLASVEAQLKV